MLEFLGGLLLLLCSIIFGGYTLSVLWAWFMVPMFGLPIISIVQALGVSMTIRLITSTNIATKSEHTLTVQLFTSIAYYAITLFIGYIVKLNM